MLTYNNDPGIKAKYQTRFAAHIAAGHVVQEIGFEFDSGRGCFLGCTLDSYDPVAFERELHWPLWFVHLCDKVHEGLPRAEAPAWGTALYEQVPIGVNLDDAQVPILLCIQRRNLARVANAPEPYGQRCRDAIQGAIDWLSDPAPAADPKSNQQTARSVEFVIWSARSVALDSGRSAAPIAWSARSAEWSAESVRSTTFVESAAWTKSVRSTAIAAWAAARSAGSAALAVLIDSDPESVEWSAELVAERAEYQALRDDILRIVGAL